LDSGLDPHGVTVDGTSHSMQISDLGGGGERERTEGSFGEGNRSVRVETPFAGPAGVPASSHLGGAMDELMRVERNSIGRDTTNEEEEGGEEDEDDDGFWIDQLAYELRSSMRL
jgi:hypothetical protein